VFDRKVPAFDVAEVAKRAQEGGQVGVALRRAVEQDAQPRGLRRGLRTDLPSIAPSTAKTSRRLMRRVSAGRRGRAACVGTRDGMTLLRTAANADRVAWFAARVRKATLDYRHPEDV
jgi:hypothetical protein